MVKLKTMLWIFILPVIPYFFTMLTIRWFLPGEKKQMLSGLPTIKVSIIVAFRNEENTLPMLLDDLSSQDYPTEFYEVILVDDHSADKTSEIILSHQSSEKFKLLQNEGRGKKTALMTGIKAADGELITTTDADCRMGKEWISSLVSCFNETRPEMIIGPVVLKERKGFFYRFQELEFCSLQGITAGTAAMNNPVMCNGANLAFRRAAYAQHSQNLHYELDSGDDVFLLHSMKKGNARSIKYLEAKNAVVTTNPAETVIDYLRQRARWLSKAGCYRDWFTIFLGIVTFVTIIDIMFLLIGGFFNAEFLVVLGIVFIVKSIADALLLYGITRHLGRSGLMKWFFPAQSVYPFYVMAVVVAAMSRRERW